MKATKAVRRRSHGDVLAQAQAQGGGGGGGMRRVTSYADVPLAVAGGGGGDGTDSSKPKLTLGQRLGMGGWVNIALLGLLHVCVMCLLVRVCADGVLIVCLCLCAC